MGAKSRLLLLHLSICFPPIAAGMLSLAMADSVSQPEEQKLHEIMVLRSKGGNEAGEIYDAAACDDSQTAFAQRNQNAISLIDSSGGIIWTKSLVGTPVSIACASDTIAVIEHGDEWDFGLLDGKTGAEIARAPLELQRAETAQLLGRTREGWEVVVESRYTTSGPPIALQFPRRSLRTFTTRTGEFRNNFSRIDSSSLIVPTANEMPSRYSLRPPFAAQPSFASLPSGLFFYHSGNSFTADVLDAAGKIVRKISIGGVAPRFSLERATALAKSWVWFESPLVPDSVFMRMVSLDSTFEGIALGRMIARNDGNLLVHRRDLDVNPVSSRGARRFDHIASNSEVAGFVTFPEGVTPVSWSGQRIAAIRRTSMLNPSGKRIVFDEVVIYRVDF